MNSDQCHKRRSDGGLGEETKRDSFSPPNAAGAHAATLFSSSNGSFSCRLVKPSSLSELAASPQSPRKWEGDFGCKTNERADADFERITVAARESVPKTTATRSLELNDRHTA